MSEEHATFEEAQEVVERWRQDFRSRPGGTYSELTVGDWAIVSDYVWSKFSDEESIILHVYEVFKREFTKGHRCGVCGRTKAQNEAIGYDCLREC